MSRKKRIHHDARSSVGPSGDNTIQRDRQHRPRKTDHLIGIFQLKHFPRVLLGRIRQAACSDREIAAGSDETQPASVDPRTAAQRDGQRAPGLYRGNDGVPAPNTRQDCHRQIEISRRYRLRWNAYVDQELDRGQRRTHRGVRTASDLFSVRAAAIISPIFSAQRLLKHRRSMTLSYRPCSTAHRRREAGLRANLCRTRAA